MKIIESILTKNPCYKQGRKITVKGLMLHSVGCNQPDASVFARGWNKSSQKSCVHAFIDGNTGEVYQTLPWNHRGWHAGSGSKGSANNTHIGVEMCEPACIKYKGGAAFTCSNIPIAKAVVERTYNSAVELFAYLCKEYNLDPLEDGVIISHKEGSKRKIASGHVDPEHIWSGLKMGYTMDGFRKAVKAAMSGEKVNEDSAPAKSESKPETAEKAPTTTTTAKTLYKVQVGAFSNKKYAEARAEKLKAAGFETYISVSDGKLYRVQTGAFAERANAVKHLAAVKKAGFSGFVTTLG